MPPQSRVGDNAFNPADAHGCPACPHPVTGPGQSGSPDVIVNGMQALRIGDPGQHAASSGSVTFNNIPAARLGDSTTHCGGSGSLIVGSANVIVGG